MRKRKVKGERKIVKDSEKWKERGKRQKQKG